MPVSSSEVENKEENYSKNKKHERNISTRIKKIN
ncbi:MAG: hypothetical protein K0S53_294 [Bacteroidetes bacterium]|jgi:hypothetical protein|nr:hypothetical protein [Bacteroidota bacterium]MDF2452995.1 hypothetical protein [Bacteroidota bacterium]